MAATPKPPSLPGLSILLAVVALFLAGPVHGQDQGGPADPSIKCGGCSPCGSATCYMSPPPPPPVEYYPPPPPPPPKKPPSPPKTGYCPPPPPPPYSPGFIYVGAPPGSLYPIDQTYSGSTRVLRSSFFGLGLLGFLSMLFL